jgi:hypothetical protein
MPQFGVPVGEFRAEGCPAQVEHVRGLADALALQQAADDVAKSLNLEPPRPKRRIDPRKKGYFHKCFSKLGEMESFSMEL